MNVMSSRCLLALFFFVLTSGCAKTPAPHSRAITANTAAEVKKINEMAKSSLGIGLVEIGMICQSGRGTYVLADSLKPAEREAVAQLEENGYATAEYVTAAEGKFVHLALTDKGLDIKKSLGVSP